MSQVEHFRALLEVSKAILAHKDLPALFRQLAQSLPSLLKLDFVGLALHEPDREVMRAYTIAAPIGIQLPQGLELPVDEAPGGWVWKTQIPLVVSNLEAEARFPRAIQMMKLFGVQCFCVLPLTTSLRRIGGMGFGRLQSIAFDNEQLNFLQQVANQVAVAVDNVLNFESLEATRQRLARERDRFRLLLEINNAVVSHHELPELLKAVSDCLRHVIPHDLAGFCIYDATTNRLLAHSLDFPNNQEFGGIGDPIPLEGTPEGLAFTSRRTVLVKKLSLVEFPSEIMKRAVAAGLKSGCAVPLIVHDRTLGTLSVVSLRENAFSEDDAVLLGNIGSQLAIAVQNAQAYQETASLKDRLSREKLYLEDEIRSELNFEEIIGESPAIKRVLKQVGIVAPTDSTVLILGETGTGKELLARAIHDRSKRRERTFVKLNCAAIPTGLLESELFGHERGAFTGAIATKVGRFELADGGTLFLDEVGDIPVELQSKLLRVLQEQEFERLGSTRTIKVSVRLLAATNRDLPEMVASKLFRSDLYYRLNVFPLTVPALRDRREDIPLLVRYFVQQLARRMDKKIATIPTDSMTALSRYDWPGNVRELENLIERAVILTQGTALHVPLVELKMREGAGVPPPATLDETEREHILKILKSTRWVIGGPTGAAAQLGMKRTTLQSKMQRFGIARPI